MSASAKGSEPRIDFVCDPALAGAIPEPRRAQNYAPAWFLQLPRECGDPNDPNSPVFSIKACLPVTDTFTLGFVIPLPYTVKLTVSENPQRIEYAWDEDCLFEPIDEHYPEQLSAPEPPFARTHPLKFMNPWRVIVPDGYAVLFFPMLNRPELPIRCLSGFVDCDRFESTVHFPFLWTGGAGDYVIEAGTPLVQVIPIRRDTLIKATEVRAATPDEQMDQAIAQHRKWTEESVYRREWRTKK